MTEQRVRRTTKRPAWLNDGADVFDEMSGREGRKSWQQQQQQQARLQVDGSSSDGFKQSRGAPGVGTVATSKLALPRRMCFNPACKNPFDSPQWRRGPLGPGTLCNACGTRYARVEARMRADKRGAPPRAVDVAEWRAFEAQLLQPLDPERAAVAAQLTAAEANAGPRSRRVARVRVAAGSMVNHPGGGLASESSPGAQGVAAAAAGRNHAHGLQQLQQRLLVLQQQEYDDECDEDDWGDEDPAADASSPCAGGSGSSQQPVGGVLPVQQLTAASTPGGGRQPSSTSLLWAALQGLPPHLRYDAMACSSSGPQTQSSPVRATAGTAPHLLLAACGGASPGSAPGAGSCGASPCKLDDGRGDGGGGAAATAGDSRAVRSPAPPNARVRPAHDDEASDSQEAAACCWREPGGTGGGSDQFLHLLAVGEAMIKTDGVALEDRQQAWSEYVQKRLPPGEPLQQPSAAAPHPGTDGAAAPRRSRLAGSEPAKALLQPAAHAAVAGANCSGPTAPIVAGGDRYERLLAEAELCIRARSASPLMRPLTPQCDTRSGGAGASCAAGADESSPAPRSRLADASRAVAAVMLPPPLLLPAAAAATTSVFLAPALIPSKDAPASVVLAMPAAASTSSCGPPPGMAGPG